MAFATPVIATIDVLAARPLTATVVARHAETVMDLSVAGGVAATIDFAGNWAVWRRAGLGRIAGGSLPGRVGRCVAVAPDGGRIAVLTGATGVDHQWRGAIIDIASGEAVPFGERYLERLAWTDAGLIAMGPLGYRVYDASGRLRVDGHHEPVPDSAWTGCAVTRDGTRAYFLCAHRIGGVALADGRSLPAPDLAPFAREPGSAAWAFGELAVSDDGTVLALGFLDEVLVWRLPGGELLARIVPTGVQLVRARARFAGDRLIACFSHVRGDGGQRKTVVAFDVAAGRIADVVTTASHVHGGKGGADGGLLVAHGEALSLAERIA